MGDLELVNRLSQGKVDLTFGRCESLSLHTAISNTDTAPVQLHSALDIFGGTGVTLQELVQWNQQG